MSIVRVEHNRDYVVMNKTGLEDPELSFKAKGILAFLLSKPDNWKCRRKHLAKVGPDGITAVDSGLKELKEKGYLEKKPIRDDKGKIREWESIIREVPKRPSQQETAQKSENPPSGQSSNWKTGESNKNLNLRSNESNKIEEEDARTHEERKKIPNKIKHKFNQVFNRKLSVEFYKKMLKIHSEQKIIYKALLVAEENGDKPSYVLKTLKDWENNDLTSVSDINTYLEERQTKRKNKEPHYELPEKSKSIVTSQRTLEEMKENGWK